MRIDLPIPQDKPFDVVGVGINVIDYLFRIPHFPEPNTKMDALGATIQGGGLTLGEAGSALLHRGLLVEVPGFRVKVVDTTGAGDVFHGAFLYGLLQGREVGDILRFANAVSALKCTRLGGRADIPTLAEVQAFLSAGPGESRRSSGKEHEQ
jgi:sugar/nucleoside kinase (ribokinase family)